jgi:hypothetical protein
MGVAVAVAAVVLLVAVVVPVVVPRVPSVGTAQGVRGTRTPPSDDAETSSRG